MDFAAWLGVQITENEVAQDLIVGEPSRVALAHLNSHGILAICRSSKRARGRYRDFLIAWNEQVAVARYGTDSDSSGVTSMMVGTTRPDGASSTA